MVVRNECIGVMGPQDSFQYSIVNTHAVILSKSAYMEHCSALKYRLHINTSIISVMQTKSCAMMPST